MNGMSQCRLCLQESTTEICQTCQDTIDRYKKTGILNMVHASRMMQTGCTFLEGEVLVPLRYKDVFGDLRK